MNICSQDRSGDEFAQTSSRRRLRKCQTAVKVSTLLNGAQVRVRITQQELKLFQSRFDKRLVLTAGAIVDISQAVSRDFAPRMQRSRQAVSAQMLRDVSQSIRRQYRSAAQRVNLAEPVCVVMPVDVEHVSVYWRLPEAGADKTPVIKLSSTDVTGSVAVFFRPQAADPLPQKMDILLPAAFENRGYQVSVGWFEEDNQFHTGLESACVGPAFAKIPDGQRQTARDTMTTLNHSGQGL